MSLTTPPVPITTATSVQLTPPSNAPWGSLVLDNLSPYLLEIQIGGQYEWLAPWTENVYHSTATHAPVTISAQVPSGVALLSGSASQIQATWFDPAEELPPRSWPVSLTASAISGLTSVLAPPPQLLYGPTTSATSGGGVLPAINFAVPSTIRTLIVTIKNPGAPAQPFTGAEVNGLVSLQTYYNQAPYLGSSQVHPVFNTLIVPIIAAVDTSYQLSLQGGAVSSNYTVTITGDTALYDESVFYNGRLQSTSVQQNATVGPATLLTGPFRMVSLAVSAQPGGAAGIVVIQQSSTANLCRADSSANGGTATGLAWSGGEIVELGDSLEYQATAGALTAASVGWCWP